MELKKKLRKIQAQAKDNQFQIYSEIENKSEDHSLKFPPRKQIHIGKSTDTRTIFRLWVIVIALLIIVVGSFLLVRKVGGSASSVSGEAEVEQKVNTRNVPIHNYDLKQKEVVPQKNEIVKKEEPAPSNTEVTTKESPASAEIALKPTIEPTEKKQVDRKFIRHLVRPGETLYRISVHYYHSGRYSEYLATRNHLNDPANLIAGKTIVVPVPPE